MSHRQLSFQTDTTEYTITSTIPLDDTTPLVSEGTEIFSKAFTPTAADSIINFEFGFSFSDASAALTMTVALFEGSTCIGAFPFLHTLNRELSGVARFRSTASDTSERTYSIRVGRDANTLYLNRDVTAGVGHGGTESMWFEINEVAP